MSNLDSESVPAEPSVWRARLWMIPPMILVLVALTQPFLVKHFHLNPSKGGGFRMFSTVDHYTTRMVRAQVEIEGEEYPVLMNNWLNRYRIASMSNQSVLEREVGNLENELPL